jgi:hypothetical protein
MKNVGCVFLIATFVTCGLAARAQAEDERPGIFTYAYQGLVVGGGVGLAAGYLAASDDAWKDNWGQTRDWKPMAYGVGIGALAGSGIGLTLGILDTTQNKPGRTHYILRDMAYGVGFGATAGAIVGGLTAISAKDATEGGKDVLLGTSIGILSGAVLGGVVGFLEGEHARRTHSELDTENQRFALSVIPVVGPSGKIAYLPALLARY